MEGEEKKRYRVQVLLVRVKDEDEQYLAKRLLIVHSNEEKYFNKNDHVDNYIVVVRDEKLTMLLRQTTSPQPVKYLCGYDVSAGELSKHDSFCEFTPLLSNL
jgi:hypothetical protein